jgi:excisionase family DNA binding protein
MTEELLTVSQVAGALGVGERTIREWDKANVLRPDMVTSRGWRLYRRETVEKLMNERMNEVKT